MIEKNEIEPLLLKPPQAAKALGVCVRTLRSLKKSGKIPYVKIGGSVRFDPRDLRAFIDETKIGTLPFSKPRL